METDGAVDVKHPHKGHNFHAKVHGLMCLELQKFLDRISHINAAIESARPRCASGVNALCSLIVAMDKAKLLIQHCTDSSKLYLAITADRILLRCRRIQNSWDLYLFQLQNTVSTLLAAKIYGVIEDLKNANFHIESSEAEAGKVVLALIRQDIPASECINVSEFKAIQLAALNLVITSPLAVLVEKRSIKRMLLKVHQDDPMKEKILKYLLYLLRKYGELILQEQTEKKLSTHEGPKCQSSHSDPSVTGDEIQAEGTPTTPEEFVCPISMRLMYDPVLIASGKTYERVWIEKWFSEGRDTCPITHVKLDNLSLTPNYAMRSLISKWCSNHGISIADPFQLSVLAPVSPQQSSSPKSVASFGISMNDLRLQLSNVSLRSSDTNHDSQLIGDDGLSLGDVPQMKVDAFTGSSINGHDVGFASLLKLASLPWELQCKTVQNVKEQLNKNEQEHDWIFSNIFMKQFVKFLIDAHDCCDERAQKDSTEVILAILSKERMEMPLIDGDSIYLLASFLDSKITGKALLIMETLSRHDSCKSAIVAVGVLPSLLKILDTQNREFHELAVKILSNLSCNGRMACHIVYLDFIPKLVPFLSDCILSRYCLSVMKNLCLIEEGRKAIYETDSCITSIANLLETETTEHEQETTLEILLWLCGDQLQCCQRIMRESVVQSLFSLAVNGTSKGKAIAMELLLLFGQATEGVLSDSSKPSLDFSSEYSSNQPKEEKYQPKAEESSSIFGYMRRKISRLLH